MSNILIAVFAYLIDRKFGEFKFMRHPVEIFGELITFFEEKFYKDSVIRGVFLVLLVLSFASLTSWAFQSYLALLPFIINVFISSILASIFIAHHMLLQSVKEVLDAEDKREAIAMLVSRDTAQMQESDIYKAAIETYAENMNDGVVAPLFYLLLFGFMGIVIYKSVNTMDSMVGYKNERYKNYGKAAALLDDVLNYIPARITAMLIMLSSKEAREKYGVFGFYKFGKAHESPNAGHPISAMALILDVKLGGDTYYFGALKQKPYFGNGREKITREDVENSLRFLRPKP